MSARPHKNRNRAPISPLNLPTLSLTTGGLGFLRPAPGSWGSLPPVLIAGLMGLGGASAITTLAALAVILLLSSAACVVFGRYAETRFALPDGSPQKDAPEVVADETAGMALALMALPLEVILLTRTGSTGSMHTLIAHPAFELGAAFILFRAFDTLKPWPMRKLEKVRHGWGVLLDDLAAGVYAGVAHGALYYLMS